MSTPFRFALPLALLALVPVVSHAGPVHWSYTSRSDTVNGAPWLSLGTVGQWAWSPETGEYYESHRLYNARSEYESSGSFSDSLLSTHPRDAIIVGGVGYPEVWVPADEPVDRVSDSAVSIMFTITDDASGESGDIDFVFTPRADGVYTSGTGVVGWRDAPQSANLALGGNQYTVTVNQQSRESWSPLVATVDVVAGVPEPSTLLLAAAGISCLGWFRRRK